MFGKTKNNEWHNRRNLFPALIHRNSLAFEFFLFHIKHSNMFKLALTHKHRETDNNEQTGTSTVRRSQQETNWQRRVQTNRLRTTHADRHRLRLPHKDTSQHSAETKARLAQSWNGVRMLHNGLRHTYRWHLNVKFPKIKEGSGEFSSPAAAIMEEYYRAKEPSRSCLLCQCV